MAKRAQPEKIKKRPKAKTPEKPKGKTRGERVRQAKKDATPPRVATSAPSPTTLSISGVEFDWSSAHRFHAGITPDDVVRAFAAKDVLEDTHRRLSPDADDGRGAFFAQAGNRQAPYLHISYTVVDGKVRPFHARLMEPAEIKRFNKWRNN
jgi:hypothetical protein